jgi:hypothetical protein
MGRMRNQTVFVSLGVGEEIRVSDVPSSDPIKNFTVSVAPSYTGSEIPVGVGLVCTVYYGGGYSQPAVAYGPLYKTGVQQATTTLLPASFIPQRIFSDSKICTPDRWRDGATVREDANLARALHLYNHTGVAIKVRVSFIAEELNEAR